MGDPAPDPAVAAVLEELQGRHTGLSETELDVVAQTIVEEARRHEMDPRVVMAVIVVESSGYNFARSHVGALGLMQIMPATGEELARELDIAWRGPSTLFDPVQNIRLGVAYLRQLSDRYGELPAALAAYNWGPARIDSRIRRGRKLPSLYVEQVLKAYDTASVDRPQRS